MRRLIGLLLTLSVAVPLGKTRGQRVTASEALYLIDAVADATRAAGPSYPVWLYTVSQDKKLLRVRQLFTAEENFRDIADDLHGTIYLAADSGVLVLHEEDPERRDFVPVQDFDDYPCWGAFKPQDGPSGVLFCDGTVRRILSTIEPGKPRVTTGNYAVFTSLQYGGQNGGPYQQPPPLAELAGTKIMLPYTFPPNVELAELPSDQYVDPAERRRVIVLAATDRYLVVWIMPGSMVAKGSITTEDTRHQEPLQVNVLDKRKGGWRTLELPTATTLFSSPTVRLFGDWLVATVTHFDASRPVSPGSENERGESGANPELPNIGDWYMNHLLYLFFPGELRLQNLSDGRQITLRTHQQDSEVLAIREDGRILYRVNDVIYLSSISQNEPTAPILVTKGDPVEDVHWVFWGPAAMPETHSKNSRHSN